MASHRRQAVTTGVLLLLALLACYEADGSTEDVPRSLNKSSKDSLGHSSIEVKGAAVSSDLLITSKPLHGFLIVNDSSVTSQLCVAILREDTMKYSFVNSHGEFSIEAFETNDYAGPTDIAVCLQMRKRPVFREPLETLVNDNHVVIDLRDTPVAMIELDVDCEGREDGLFYAVINKEERSDKPLVPEFYSTLSVVLEGKAWIVSTQRQVDLWFLLQDGTTIKLPGLQNGDRVRLPPR